MSESYHISLPEIVETPLLLRVMRWMGFLDTRLPLEVFPLMARVEKSYSEVTFLSLVRGRKNIFTVSASPLWLALNQSRDDPGVPLVMS